MTSIESLQPELNAVASGAALYDRTAWGRIQVSDADRLAFLHNQSTNDLKSRKPGEGCDTVFLTSTARTIDLASVYILDDSVLLLVSPSMSETLMKMLDRYIFFADKVALTNVSDKTAAFSLIGPQSHAILEQLGAGEIVGQPYGTHRLLTIAGEAVRVAVGSGLATAGYTLICDREFTMIPALCAEAGAKLISDRAWEYLRIVQGRPMPGHELTEDYNPLEAGLWQAISFNKGCYIGQETIARLDTYNGVKQQLWGIRLQGTTEVPTLVTMNGEKVGTITSVMETDQGAIGLVYIRSKAGGAGLTVTTAAGNVGEVVDVTFLTREKQG